MVDASDVRQGPSGGFTLIELLIVIAIIMIMLSLLLPFLSLFDTAKDATTKERIRNVTIALQANLGSERALDEVQDMLLPEVVRWDSLRAVLGAARAYGVDMTDLAYIEDDPTNPVPDVALPPHVRCVYDPKCGNRRPRASTLSSSMWVPLKDHPAKGVTVSASTLDRAVVFGYWDNTTANIQRVEYGDLLGRYWPNFYYARVSGTKFQSITRERNRDLETDWWVHKDIGLIVDPSFRVRRHPTSATTEPLQYAYFYDRRSRRGELLDQTLEVVPSGPWLQQDYLDHWPTLIEYETDALDEEGNPVLDEDGEVVRVVVQRAWPDADWDQAVPGTHPPLWEQPFGKKVIAQRSGGVIEQFHRRAADHQGNTVADFSPLGTIELLLKAGIIESAEQYRKDRSPQRPWNDAWGNPLVCAMAICIPPRHDVVNDLAATEAAYPGFTDYYNQRDDNGVAFPYMFVDCLQGPRDWMMKAVADNYGSARQIYIVVGAVGPARAVCGTDNPIETALPDYLSGEPLTWDEANDDVVLRALWLQVRERCLAEEWNEEAFGQPPWDGVRKKKPGGGEVVFLGAPEVFP